LIKVALGQFPYGLFQASFSKSLRDPFQTQQEIG